MTTSLWTAGASSALPLVGDGWFSFRVPVGSAGVFVGVSWADASPHPSEPAIGFMFQSGAFRIEQRGAPLGVYAPYSAGQMFSIVRHGGAIYLCTGGGTTYPGVPFGLPGGVLYSQPAGSGGLYLDASLLAGGDAVYDAEMIDAGAIAEVSPDAISAMLDTHAVIGATNEAVITILREAAPSASAVLRFPTMVLAAASGVRAVAGVAFEPMELQADAGASGGISINMLPPVAMGADGERNDAHLLLESMTLSAFRDATINRAEVSFAYPLAGGHGPGTDAAHIEFGYMGVNSGDDASYAEASAYIGPLYVRASGGQHIVPGIHMTVGLPMPSGAFGAAYTTIDGAFASDAVMGGSTVDVADGATVWMEFSGGTASLQMTEVLAWASDAPLLGGTQDLEGVALADEIVSLDGDADVSDTALAADEATPQTVSTRDVADGALAGDEASSLTFFDVTATAVAEDDAFAGGEDAVTDVALAGEDALPTTWSVSSLADGALADDELTARVDSQALLQSTAVADEVILMKRPGLVAWVMNTDTGAVSWYDNWAFTSMATVGGKVFAAGPDGLHVLGGDLDGTELIDARVGFGYTDFGGYDQDGMPKPSEPKKRVTDLWFGYHADGTLSATVETYGQGYGPYTYSMVPRAAGQPRNSRITPGRGLNARYWRVGIKNTNGCAFEVHSLAADVVTSTRRL